MFVIQPNSSDNFEIGLLGLNHEKLAHRDCVFEHDVSDVSDTTPGGFRYCTGVARPNASLPVSMHRQYELVKNFANCNAVSAEGFSDMLGLLYAAGRKAYFLCAIPGREVPYSFSDVDVSAAQQNNFAALL